MIRKKSQTFLDGLVRICAVENIAAPGDTPRDGLVLKERLCFDRRTLGLTRYYTAMQAHQRVDEVIRCPLRKTVSAQDVAVIEGAQYSVQLVQRPKGAAPPVMDLTLTRLEQEYGFAKGESGAFDGGPAGKSF